MKSLLRWPSRFVLKKTALVTVIAATISISVSTGIRVLVGAEADTITIVVRLVLPFAIAIPLGLWWFSRLERLDNDYRNLLKEANELSRRANTDPLTGLLNRRSFVEQFDLAMSHRIRGGFLICDVDYMKSINDRHGHLVGDTALQCVAAAMTDTLGDGSLVARIGGDEFCAFVPLSEGRDSGRLTAEIAKAVKRNFQAATGLEDTLSVSCGYMPCRPGKAFQEMMEAADSSLYRKKRIRHASMSP